MIEEIKKEISLLENDREIKILYAVESGSRAWGFASKDSDWDVRFIYVHNIDWYLSIDEKKDNIEFILPNDIDLSGWELKKALKLFRKSNPPLLEWLRSPIVYKNEVSFADDLRNASKIYFNPKSCLYHYLHMAKGNWETYFKEETVRVKKYFYVLRPLLACAWIEKKNEMAPMEFEKTFKDYNLDNNVKFEIEQLLKRKVDGEELDKEKRIPVLDKFILGLIDHFEKYILNFDFKNIPDTNFLNQLFRTTLEKAWR